MNSQQQSLSQDPLAALAIKFEQWREKRSSKREKLPAELLDQALDLAASLPNKSILLKKLRINYTQLKRHENARAAKSKKLQQASIEFVQLPSPPVTDTLISTPVVDVVRQDGQKIQISGLTMGQLFQLVNDFVQPVVQEG